MGDTQNNSHSQPTTSFRKVQKYVDAKGIDFPIVLDPKSSVSRSYGVQYTNTHVLIDKEGNLVRIVPGDIKGSDITALLQ